MAIFKMNLSSNILLGCAVLIAVQAFGFAMECVTSEDEQVCNRSCQNQGYRYGMCDYSDCTCYGRTRRPNGASMVLGNGPADGSKLVPQRPALQERNVQGARSGGSATTKGPLKCTSAVKTVLNEKVKSSYESCESWCRDSFMNVYVSLDNLCCCQRK